MEKYEDKGGWKEENKSDGWVSHTDGEEDGNRDVNNLNEDPVNSDQASYDPH
uniref:Uncharacterized protein n=1 Tax=Oryza sativa subsp. japonica TaxID=39947 RepID=Q5Z4B6_ORYSJ|nr:hypothetical protein [Oryza sativa Japonica Group]BAD62416.1 hypothetical protein [Oryza sativa Japonica Group]